MITIDKNDPPSDTDLKIFLSSIDFKLPSGFIEFFKGTNGADISSEENYMIIWPLTELIDLNEQYAVEEFAPSYFLFGSDGGDTAYAIKKETGFIFEIPFIGMSDEEALFLFESFDDFLDNV